MILPVVLTSNKKHDVYNDTSNNGLTDILKRNESTVQQLIAPLGMDNVVEFAGVRFKETTTAPSVTISSNTYYNTYIYGDDAIFSVFLGKNPESGDRNYKLYIQEAPSQGSVSDPARQIGGYAVAPSTVETPVKAKAMAAVA